MNRKPFIDIVLAGVFLGLALVIYGSWYSHVSTLSSQAAGLEGELQSAQDTNGRSAGTRRALDEIGKQENTVYSHFVGDGDVVPYLESIGTLGTNLGAKVEIVSVGNTPAKPPRPSLIQLAVRITGSFDAVVRTLGAIEYQPYDTTLTSLTLDTPLTDKSGWTAAAVFSVGMIPEASTTQMKMTTLPTNTKPATTTATSTTP